MRRALRLDRPSALLRVCALAACGSGCATTQPASVRDFGDAVAQARRQAVDALASVDALAADDVVDYAAAQARLREEDLLPVLADEDVARWGSVLSAFERYADLLARLTDPAATSGFDDAMIGLAGELETVSHPVSPAIETAVGRLADVLLHARAARDARRTAAAIDPAVGDALRAMAAVVGKDDGDGLRGTAASHWRLLLARDQAAFLAASPGVERRRITRAFAGAVARRRLQDQELAALRRSLLALADAHHALATGRPLDFAASVAWVKQEAAAAKALYDRFDAAARE